MAIDTGLKELEEYCEKRQKATEAKIHHKSKGWLSKLWSLFGYPKY